MLLRHDCNEYSWEPLGEEMKIPSCISGAEAQLQEVDGRNTAVCRLHYQCMKVAAACIYDGIIHSLHYRRNERYMQPAPRPIQCVSCLLILY